MFYTRKLKILKLTTLLILFVLGVVFVLKVGEVFYKRQGLLVIKFLSSALLKQDSEYALIAGVNNDGMLYNITATKLTNYFSNLLEGDDLILENPRLTILTLKNKISVFHGIKGVYSGSNNTLNMLGNVHADHMGVYNLNTTQLTINTKTYDLLSEQLVTMKHKEFTIKANKGGNLFYDDAILVLNGSIHITIDD